MTDEQLQGWMDANRLIWDDRTPIHLRNRTGFYPIDRVRDGDNGFGEPEDSELGDMAGKRLIHLQCHFGLDTIRLARRGAIATGLDFSTAAITAASTLAAELGVPVRFVEGMSMTPRRCSMPNTTSLLSPGDRSSGYRTFSAGRGLSPDF
jgi:hypothetical protein